MNVETISPVLVERQEVGSINHNTIRRIGSIAAREQISLTKMFEQIDADEAKRQINGEMREISSKSTQEFSTESFDGRTGLILLAENKNGKRYIFSQEDSEKGIESLGEQLSKIPDEAKLKRAVVLTPEGKKGNFSKDDRFLDHLTLIIDHFALLRDRENQDSVLQVITYPKEQNPADYLETKLSIKCSKDGTSEIYHGTDIIEPSFSS